MGKSPASILHLNDECLSAIFEQVRGDRAERIWSRVCKRFAKFYCDYYIHKLIVEGYEDNVFDDRLVTIFGHLIGTELFPLTDIKTLKFDETHSAYYNKYFFNTLRKNHRGIEAIEFYGFMDKDLNDLLPLPNVKRMHFKYSCITGKYIDRLQSLEELIVESTAKFESKHLLGIAKQNSLRKLILRCCPLAFSLQHAHDIVEELKYLEELEVSWCDIHQYQFFGALPRLKILIVNDFKTYQCQTCKEFDLGMNERSPSPLEFDICNCGFYEAKLLFNSLRQNLTLEQLVFIGYRLTTRDLLHITQLTSLRMLYIAMDKMPLYVSLAIFGNLRNLEELDLGYSWKLPTEALELLHSCQKLKFVNFGNCAGFNTDFILKAIEIVKRRALPPMEPVKLQLFNPDFDKVFLEDERVKAAKSFISIDYFKSTEIRRRLLYNVYQFEQL